MISYLGNTGSVVCVTWMTGSVLSRSAVLCEPLLFEVIVTVLGVDVTSELVWAAMISDEVTVGRAWAPGVMLKLCCALTLESVLCEVVLVSSVVVVMYDAVSAPGIECTGSINEETECRYAVANTLVSLEHSLSNSV